MVSASAPFEVGAAAPAADRGLLATSRTHDLLPAPPATAQLPAPVSLAASGVLDTVHQFFSPSLALDVLIERAAEDAKGEQGVRVHLVLPPPAGGLSLEAEVASLWGTMRRHQEQRDALLAALLRRTGAASAALVMRYAEDTPEVSFARLANGRSVAATVLAR